MEEGETKTVLNTTSDGDCSSNITGESDHSYKNFAKSYKNGSVNGLELLMSMASDLNRNIPVKNGGSRENTSSSCGNDNTAVNSNRNHASQLLLAAASVVSNGFVTSSNGLRPSCLPSDSRIQDCRTSTVTTCAAGNLHSGTDRTLISSTAVSFSSKPTMSTGFSEPNLTVPSAPISTPTNLALSQSKMSAIVNNSKQESCAGLDTLNNKSIVVPFLWKRVNVDGVIHYHSPSDEVLKSVDKVKEYLLSEETCKCGLPCPFHIDKVFNFDAIVNSQSWKLPDIDIHVENTVRCCCHRKYIKSCALTKECQTVPKPVKPPPSRRRAKPVSQSAGNKKSNSNISRKIAQQMKKISEKSPTKKGDVTAGSCAAITSAHTSNTSTPIPPIETVMRSPLSLAYASHNEPGIHSPRHLTDMVSPGMPLLSPHASANQNSHMVPVIAHTGYPHSNSSLMAQPFYRHPADPGLLPGAQHGYYGMSHSHGAMPSYHPTGYENHPRPWNSPPSFPPMPPPGTQFGPPIWQARPEAPSRSDTAPNMARKRRRRASSRSSNGGNSDTGYTSGLSSPAHASPGQNKLQDKTESLFKSKLTEDRKLNPTTESITVNRASEPHSSSSVPLSKASSSSNVGNSNLSTTTSALPDISVLAQTSVIRSTEQVMVNRIQMPQTHPQSSVPDGLPYIDPMYRSRHISPGYQHPLPPMYLPNTNRALMYFAQPPHSATVVSPHLHMTQHDSAENLTVNEFEKELAAAKHRNSVTNESIKSKLTSTVNTTNSSQGNMMSHHSQVAASTNWSSQSMLMNGFQPLFNQHIAPGMPYPSAIANDYSYTARPPIPMMRTPNRQLIYRYAQPRMPVPPQAMSYHPSSNPMYHQPPFISGPTANATYAYPHTNTPPASPKRKRRKGNSKAVIESHSAVLAETDDKQDKATADTVVDPTRSIATNGSQVINNE